MNVKWIIFAGLPVLLVAALAVGLLSFFAAGGDGASCDEIALQDEMRLAIDHAERTNQIEAAINMPEGCTDDDVTDALPAVTRSWHNMPGGRMMREAEHDGP